MRFNMKLTKEELIAAILPKTETSPQNQLYMKDFYVCDPDTKPRKLKNIAHDLMRTGKCKF